MRERGSPTKRRERFGQWVRRRASLRLVMLGIVAGTTAAGAVVSSLLFRFGVTGLGLRTVLSVVASYGFFLLLVRLWLANLGLRDRGRAEPSEAADALDRLEMGLDGVDAVDFVTSGTGPVGRLGSGASGRGSGGGWDVGGDADDIVAAIVLAVLVLVAVVAGGYLVWEAPVLLAETLFEFSLASALARRLGGGERGDWLGHLVRRTWIPFTAVLVVASLFAVVVGNVRPDAQRVRDLWRPALTAPP